MKTILFIRVTVLCIIALFVYNVVKSQDKKKVTVLPVPVIGYTPETNIYFGAVTLFTINNVHDSLTRTSNAKIEFNYTWEDSEIKTFQRFSWNTALLCYEDLAWQLMEVCQ